MLVALLRLAHEQLPRGCTVLSHLNATSSASAPDGHSGGKLRHGSQHPDWGDAGGSARILSVDVEMMTAATAGIVGTYGSTLSELLGAHAGQRLLLVHASKSTRDALRHATPTVRGGKRRSVLMEECIEAWGQLPMPMFESKRTGCGVNTSSGRISKCHQCPSR